MTKKERTGMAKKWNKQQQVQQQIPCGNDKKERTGMANNERTGMTKMRERE
jgi:hypothetical protein